MSNAKSKLRKEKNNSVDSVNSVNSVIVIVVILVMIAGIVFTLMANRVRQMDNRLRTAESLMEKMAKLLLHFPEKDEEGKYEYQPAKPQHL
jgi:p-aminobenzoyl-glutamate transporter AbgT